MEDNDLDALMADLVADLNATEEKFASERGTVKDPMPPPPPVSIHVPSAHFTPAAPTAPPALPPSQSKAELTRLPSNTSGLTSITSNTSLPPAPPSNSKPSTVNLSHTHKDTHRLAFSRQHLLRTAHSLPALIFNTFACFFNAIVNVSKTISYTRRAQNIQYI